MSEKEKKFFKTCFNIVAGLEVKNESQAIAKEVILDEVENLQNNWNELKKWLEEEMLEYKKVRYSSEYGYAIGTMSKTLKKMQELEQGKDE